VSVNLDTASELKAIKNQIDVIVVMMICGGGNILLEGKVDSSLFKNVHWYSFYVAHV